MPTTKNIRKCLMRCFCCCIKHTENNIQPNASTKTIQLIYQNNKGKHTSRKVEVNRDGTVILPSDIAQNNKIQWVSSENKYGHAQAPQDPWQKNLVVTSKNKPRPYQTVVLSYTSIHGTIEHKTVQTDKHGNIPNVIHDASLTPICQWATSDLGASGSLPYVTESAQLQASDIKAIFKE